jgi:hypothetical protein
MAVQITSSCVSVQARPIARNGAHGTALIPQAIYASRPGTSFTAARKQASWPRDPVQVYGGYTKGTSPVHGRYMTGSGGSGPDIRWHREPLRRYSAARSYGALIQAQPAGHGRAGLPPRQRRHAPSQYLRHSLNGMAGADPAACPAAGTDETRPPPGAGRTAKNQSAGRTASTSQTSSPGARATGQNGRESAKRAVICTASFTRTLYTICTRTLPRIDPQ